MGKLGKNVVKGGPGSDETQKVFDDGKGWVWLAADMSPGGLGVALYTSVPYGKRPLLVAKRSDVDGMFAKVNWGIMDKRIDSTIGGPPDKAALSPALRRRPRQAEAALLCSIDF